MSSLPMWHDDSSPFRSQPLELRRKLEPKPLNSLNFALGQQTRRMAVCHPKQLHWARGFCHRCYYRHFRAGDFKRDPSLRATAPA